MLALLTLHAMAHLSPAWHVSHGRLGWWAWTQAPNMQSGFGVIRGHFAFSWEVR